MSDLCGDIAQALGAFMSDQTALHISTAVALLFLPTFTPFGVMAGVTIATAFCGLEVDKCQGMNDFFQRITAAITRVTDNANSLQASCKAMMSKESAALSAPLPGR